MRDEGGDGMRAGGGNKGGEGREGAKVKGLKCMYYFFLK